MSALKKRLNLLERTCATQLDQARCAACRARPAVRVVQIDADGTEHWRNPDAHEACPRCGWRAIVVRITEADDWDSVRRAGR